MNKPLAEDIDFLAHFGVKGMRWGVTRSSSRSKESKTTYGPRKSEDAKTAQAHKAKIDKNKTTDVLSNKELQEFVTRANLEQQYSRLSVSPPTGGQKAQKMITDLLIGVGRNQAQSIVSKAAANAVKKALGG